MRGVRGPFEGGIHLFGTRGMHYASLGNKTVQIGKEMLHTKSLARQLLFQSQFGNLSSDAIEFDAELLIPEEELDYLPDEMFDDTELPALEMTEDTELAATPEKKPTFRKVEDLALQSFTLTEAYMREVMAEMGKGSESTVSKHLDKDTKTAKESPPATKLPERGTRKPGVYADIVKRSYATSAQRPQIPGKLQKFVSGQNSKDPKVKELKSILENTKPEVLVFAAALFKPHKMTIKELKEIISYGNDLIEATTPLGTLGMPPSEPSDLEKLRDLLVRIEAQSSDPKQLEELIKEFKERLQKLQPPSILEADEIIQWKKDHEELLRLIDEPNFPEKFAGSLLNLFSRELFSKTKTDFINAKTSFVAHLNAFKAVKDSKQSEDAAMISKKFAQAIDYMKEPDQVGKLYKRLYTLVRFLEENPNVLREHVELKKGDGGIGDDFYGIVDDIHKALKEVPGMTGVPKSYDPKTWFEVCKHFTAEGRASTLFSQFQRREAKSALSYRKGILAALGLAIFAYTQIMKDTWEKQRADINECYAKSENITTKIAVDNMLTECIFEEIHDTGEKTSEAIDNHQMIENLELKPTIKNFLKLMGTRAVLDFVSGDPQHSLEEYIQLHRDEINKKQSRSNLFGPDTAQNLLNLVKNDKGGEIKEYILLKKRERELNPERKNIDALNEVNKKNKKSMKNMIPLENDHNNLTQEAKSLNEVITEIKCIQDERPDITSKPLQFLFDQILNRTDKKLEKAFKGEGAEGSSLQQRLEQCQNSEAKLIQKILNQSNKETKRSTAAERLEFKNKVLNRMLSQINEMILDASSGPTKESLKMLRYSINKEIADNKSASLKEFVENEPFFQRTA